MKKLGKLRGIIVIIFLTACLLAAAFAVIVYVSNNCLRVKEYALYYDNLPIEFDGFKIVQLSDLHGRTYGENNEKLLEKVDKLSPDIVVMTGDMTEPDEPFEPVFLPLAKKLAEKYELYYIPGNHEQRALSEKWYKSLFDELITAGVKTLNNEKSAVEHEGQCFYIYGLVPDMKFFSKQKEKKNNPVFFNFSIEEMIKTLGNHDAEHFSLLLAHNPAYFETYAKWGADLTLSGHTHGGMVRIPFIGGLISPDMTLFPKYDAGLFTIEQQNMIISHGLSAGDHGFRFWNRTEIVSITMLSK